MSAVLFDLFETLITEWGRPKYTTQEIAIALDVEYSDFRREWELLHLDRYLGRLSGSERVLRTILEKLNVHRDGERIAEISRQRDACKRRCFESIEPSILRMLSDLKAMNHKLGMVSNCSDEEIQGLYGSAIYPYFDAVTLSSDVGLVKPNPEIYQHCLLQLRADPSDCAYVGDGGSNELLGAQQLGMRPFKAVWFTKQFVPGYDADKTFPSFEDPAALALHIKETLFP